MMPPDSPPRNGDIIDVPDGLEQDTMSLTLRPVRVGTGTADEDGRLVFCGDKLVAVLVCLSDEHGSMAGRWFLEHGFGWLDEPCPPTFDGLDPACAWIARRLGRQAGRSA